MACATRPRGREHPRAVSGLHTGLARRVQLRQTIVRRVSEFWISDRRLCNLASGKAVAIQDTARAPPCPPVKACFSTIEEVVEALTTINGDYERRVLPVILNLVDTRA